VVRLSWRRRPDQPTPERSSTSQVDARPEVIPVTDKVTRATVPDIVARVQRAATSGDVVVDLTGISGFDSDGAAELVRVQEAYAAGRVTLVGLRQATARLMGTEVVAASSPPRSWEPWVVRRLRAIVVVQSDGDGAASTDDLEPVLTSAMEEEVGIVVVDLRYAILTTTGIDVIAFASSTAALRGQELLIVNADAEAAEQLRRAGLSATTYVAPEPLPDS